MADTKEINVYETIKSISFQVDTNTNVVNINKVIIEGGGGTGATNLGYTPSATNGIVTSDTGADATIPLADATNAGLLTPAEKTKLQGIATGAEVNVNADWNATSGDAQILNKPTIPSISNLVPYTGANANVDLGEFELKSGQVTLDITPTGTASVGTTRWNDTLGSSETTLKGGSVILKNGVDLVARIVNKVTPTTTLTKANYQAVRVSGATGQRLSVELARANSDANSADTIGLVCETIATNQEGFILTVGQLEDVNTTGSLQSETWAEGDVLYLSPTTAGKLTNIKPNGSNGHIIVIGYVEYAHAVHGKIYVKIMNGWELDELHNVYINNPLNNQALIYETATQLWKNKTIGIQQILNNGNTTETGLIFNVASENFGVQLNLDNENSSGIGIQTNSGLAGATPISVSNENEQIFNLDNVGNVTAKAFIKDGGTSSQYLMADGSTSSGGTPAINAFSILANNTNASAVPTVKVYKEVGEQYLSGTGISATGGSLPTGTQTHSYRWSQIGNLVTLRINLQFTTAGTCSGIAIPFANMSDIPQTPQHPSIYQNALEMITYGSGNLSANKLIGTFSVGNGASGIRLSASANTYEVVVGRASNAYANGWIHIQYFI